VTDHENPVVQPAIFECIVALNDWILNLYRPPIIVLVEFLFLLRRARIASNGTGDKLNENERSTTCFTQVLPIV
jgi:hypothetical protein